MKHIKTPIKPGGGGTNTSALYESDGSLLVLNIFRSDIGPLLCEVAEAVNAYDDLIAQRKALAEACNALLDLVTFMSGSLDFSPEGRAHEGWVKLNPAIQQGIDALAKARREGE